VRKDSAPGVELPTSAKKQADMGHPSLLLFSGAREQQILRFAQDDTRPENILSAA
jgi:hypothetical protein